MNNQNNYNRAFKQPTNTISAGTSMYKNGWAEYCNYWRHYKYFLITSYSVTIFYMSALLKYILQWGWIPNNVVPPLFLYLFSAFIGTIFVYITTIVRIVYRREYNTESLIYIPFIIYQMLSFSLFFIKHEDFFAIFFITQIAVFSSYFFWRWSQKQALNNKYLIIIISIGFTLLTSLCVTHCLYYFYKSSDFLTAIMNSIWDIFPVNILNNSFFMDHQSSFAIGITLILTVLSVLS